jgi:lipopolysaccharide/colanic/teichoic acid biosynthesis glycosyltransferase
VLTAEPLARAPAPEADALVTGWETYADDSAGVFEEDLFRDVLQRERRRSDRFERSFVLAVVAPREGLSASGHDWVVAARALDRVKRDSDVVGWLHRDEVLGMLLPGAGPAALKRIEARINTGLSHVLQGPSRGRLLVRVFVYEGPDTTVPRESPVWAEPPLSRIRRYREVIKRSLDLACSLILLTILAPVFAAIAALVWLGSPGPVLFRQTRVGRYGVPFTMLKFRTMHVDADHSIHELYISEFIARNRPAANGRTGETFKIENDPRVTRVGRLLRKASLDEIPQLWNVLRGEMSLVGPRPPLEYEVERYKPWHLRRILDTKPGMTGLWQVTGRSRTTFDEMVRLDLRYARSHSLATDLKILLATVEAVRNGKGAC